MLIKKYLEFLREAQEAIDPSGFEDMRDDVEKMVKETIGKDGDVKEFAQKYLKNPEQTEIVGIVNDDQVHDFWLKYENQIDELLNKIKFFEESPEEMNAIGTYKYIIVSTKRAVLEIIRMLAN